MAASSRMTKDQLREALIEVGVSPQSKLKKADLVKLYREHVLKQEVASVTVNDSIVGGFSSDEEEPIALDTSHINNETNVAALTNDEIFYKLQDLGENVGPILDSTRKIYERKLMRLLGGIDEDAFDTSKVAPAGGLDISAFSDDDEVDKDETDEYDVAGDKRDEDKNGISLGKQQQQTELDSEYSKRAVHDKLLADLQQDERGSVVRSRRAAASAAAPQLFTPEAKGSNGKAATSFVPPPPKRSRMGPAVIAAVLVVLAVVGVLVWLNLEGGSGFSKIPSMNFGAGPKVIAKEQNISPPPAVAAGGPANQ